MVIIKIRDTRRRRGGVDISGCGGDELLMMCLASSLLKPTLVAG